MNSSRALCLQIAVYLDGRDHACYKRQFDVPSEGKEEGGVVGLQAHVFSWLWRADSRASRCWGAHSTSKRATADVFALAVSFSFALPSMWATSFRYSIGRLPMAAWASLSRQSGASGLFCCPSLLLLAPPFSLRGSAAEEVPACGSVPEGAAAASPLGSPGKKSSYFRSHEGLINATAGSAGLSGWQQSSHGP